MKVALIFGIFCLVLITSQAEEETATPKQGGFRNWLKDQLGITTTTTAKPDLVNRVHSFYHEAKDKANQLLDPRTLAAKIIAGAIQGG
ncbi:unnamed protein product [Allacma fusca]|uniref:Uncharacterized protein n=1 Tax=Allacma fusca TaxID=39272 RepID=A0A8J2IZV1_9HEXA|nr:unnamed protein product [Allacma fusca]